ncbi:MAG: wax ester/triacylglycerol synthase family O-acyltransferase [Anaerolineales bacterium]|nr:wax ester/triacylglycerol synthase family O-acyltransferase [Anaerolineales bacterium]
MSRKPLSYIDRTWLRMDDPNNLIIITGIIILGSPLDVELLKTSVENTLFRYKRFRQRVVQPSLPLMRPYWEDAPDFDINQHIHQVVLPPPADQGALEDLISELMSYDLDASRPLWEFYIVENYGEGSALICRLHHSIADGIALVQVLLSMADTDPGVPRRTRQPDYPAERKRDFQEDRYHRAKLAWDASNLFGKKLVGVGNKILKEPGVVREYIQQGANTAAAAGRLALRWPDPQTLFKGPVGSKKRATWSDPLSLEEVKGIGQALGGTVNDVLLSLVTGALRRYLQSRGESVDGVNIRGVIPVNLRPIEFDGELGNKLGLVFLELPVGTSEPLSRLYELKRNMDDLKLSNEAMVAFGILNVVGAVPRKLQDIVVSIFDMKGTAVMTNVPGPKDQLYLAGAPIETVMAWVPQSGSLGLGVSIVSYFGKVWLGVATDQGLVPDPERIIGYFVDELMEMRSLADVALGKRHKPIAPMLSQLDEALSTLDDLLAIPRQADETMLDARSSRCLGRTKSGRQCKNRALPGKDYCRVHLG